MLQQGDHFEKQEQKFSVVPIGCDVAADRRPRCRDQDADCPKPMVKKAIGDTLDYLAGNLKTRAEQLSADS